jgi:hypothetical protein
MSGQPIARRGRLATLALHDFVEGGEIRAVASLSEKGGGVHGGQSETAVAKNWLKRVPSAFARRVTSAFTDVGRAQRVGAL